MSFLRSEATRNPLHKNNGNKLIINKTWIKNIYFFDYYGWWLLSLFKGFLANARNDNAGIPRLRCAPLGMTMHGKPSESERGEADKDSDFRRYFIIPACFLFPAKGERDAKATRHSRRRPILKDR